MHQHLAMIVIAASCALSACKPAGDGGTTAAGAGGVDANLECAALISGASQLMAKGSVESDAALTKRALVSSMTYLNAYAIPKRLKEAQAFDEVKSLRGSLVDKLSAAEIVSRAKRCVERSPL